MHLAIVGIRGIPNNYGGFEPLAEYLVEYLAMDMEITVFCSSKDMDSSLSSYKGANLKYIPLSSHGASGILYDSIALIKAVTTYDKVLLLGFGGGFVMPLLQGYRSKIILNIGGLDWKRNKWSPFQQRVIKSAEWFLMKYCGQVVSDNKGIQDYISNTYGRESTLIAYGADQAERQPVDLESIKEYSFLSGEYAFSVNRIQPDNNIDMILSAFSKKPDIAFVMVGNWTDSEYGIKTRIAYSKFRNLHLLDAIYDRRRLDILRSNCQFYIHGHSAGGTNPSLVEAMYLGLPVFAFASGYNEYTTEYNALYFKDLAGLERLIETRDEEELKLMGSRLEPIARKLYLWKFVARAYKGLILG